jgi:hypothetical protein
LPTVCTKVLGVALAEPTEVLAAGQCDPVALAGAKAVFDDTVGLRTTETLLVDELDLGAAARILSRRL